MRWITVALFMLIAISLGILGQISLKYGMKHSTLANSSGLGGAGLVANLLHAFLSPYVLLGIACYALSTCFYLIVISRWQLSYAYPLIAISYVGVVLLSRPIFKEAVTAPQWIGICLMCTGFIIIARFGAATG